MDDEPSVEPTPVSDRLSDGRFDLDEGAEWRLLVQRPYDPTEDDDLTSAIVEAVAQVTSVPVRDVSSPTLYEVADVDAIERCFFASRRNRLHHSTSLDGWVRFRYLGYWIVVTSDGWIGVSNRPDRMNDD